MKVGAILHMVPTLDTSAFKKEKVHPMRCKLISMNEPHRHFTVEFDFNGHPIRECYKAEEAPD